MGLWGPGPVAPGGDPCPSAVPHCSLLPLPSFIRFCASLPTSLRSCPPSPPSLSTLCPGYKDVVVHEALPEVAHDGVLGDLGQQHHVVHPALLHIVALPVEALLAALGVEMMGQL